MSNDYLVPTGVLIKDYLEEYNITQKELMKRTGISEKHISNVIKGKSRLTEEFALKLEKVISGVEASYWLNYEAKYREYIARKKEIHQLESLDLPEIAKVFRFKEVFKDIDLSLVEQAIEMLKLLKISNFSQFDKAYDDLAIDFMEDGGEKEAIAVWLNLCESEIEIQNKDLSSKPFDPNKLEESLNKFKILANNEDTKKSILSCRKLCNRLGIYFVRHEAITNCKVRGALTTYDDHPTIYISGRFRSHEHIWFAILHELSHLVLHYNSNDRIVSVEDDESGKEQEANQLTRDILIDREKYAAFTSEGTFTRGSIIAFASSQKITASFVVGFLQHDKYIEFDQFKHL